MNWNIFKKADVESKDRIKCNQCHVYLPENYLEPKCEYCLGIKTRKVKVHKPEPVQDRMSAEPVQDLDLELHGSEGPAEIDLNDVSGPGKCESCGSVVPGLISRYCINCSIKALHYG